MNKQPLGEYLVVQGALTRNELAAAIKKNRQTKKKLTEILLEYDTLHEARLMPLLGNFYGLQVFPLSEVNITPELAALVPKTVALRHSIVPVSCKDDDVFIACFEPVNPAVIENLRRLTGKRISTVLMSPGEIRELLQYTYQSDALPFAGEERPAAQAPDYVVKVLDSLLAKAVTDRASDMHFEPDAENLRIRLRIDGRLKTVDRLPADITPLIISRLKVLGGMNIAEKRSPQDGGFLFRHESGLPVNVRISTLPCARGEKAVLRLFSLYDKDLRIEDLGMEDDMRESFDGLLRLPHGLILVTGPTGSGKTFTLYAALKTLCSDSVNIITVEDPIELQMAGIVQTQVDESAKKLTFSSVLRAVLRQDPDIVMVGEIRDSETAKLALQAALTGHLVLSTLHTNDAASAIDRLMDMGCEPYLVSSALRGVLAQRLIRTVCDKCKKEYDPAPSELESLFLAPDSREVFFSGEGCVSCQGTGYRGRTGIFELLVINREVQKKISAGADTATIRESVKGSMRSLREDGILKLRKGISTVTEIHKATMEF
jgi:type IV pilus assembly protein PilB